MKTIKLSFLFIFFLAFTIACDDDDDTLLGIDDLPVSGEVSLDYLPLNLVGFSTPPVDFNVREALENEIGTDDVLNVVNDIELDDLDIELISCDDQSNFNFLDKVELYAQTPTQDRILIAERDNVPNDVTTFDLETVDRTLDDYALDEDLQLVIKYFSNEPATNLVVELQMEFDADIIE